MAGIGVKLNRIYRKNSLSSKLYGFAYSTVITVAPMFVVIGTVLLSQALLQFSHTSFMLRELFADTLLYTFIFSLLTVAPFNAVLSKYISDIFFEEKFEDVMPCFYVGLVITVIFGSLFAIPFCIHEYLVGEVAIYYVFTGYWAYMSLVLVFYSMIYMSIVKVYGKISLFFIISMLFSMVLSVWLHYIAGVEKTYALLFSLASGFTLIATLEYSLIHSYFRMNSGEYMAVLRKMKHYWKMILINFLYTLGLYIHNFVFWNSELQNVLAKTFVTAQPYDMATCLAMFTNISATIIFITNIELHFRDRYRLYFEMVLGGRGHDIDNAKDRLFRQVGEELFTLIRLQFIISVTIFLICMVVLPMFGFAGIIMLIYPSLCVGYFILFVMYSEILFLYYFNDLNGALLTAAVFCSVTFIGSVMSSQLPEYWFGIGLVIGAFSGFTVAYNRIQWIELNLNAMTFCPKDAENELVASDMSPRPGSMVYEKSRSTWVDLDKADKAEA